MKPKTLTFALVWLLVATPATADQNSPRLDELFTTLNGDLPADVATAVTREIWSVWMQHDDSRVQDLMDAGERDMHAQRFDAARDQFTAAIALAPDFAEAWNKRATVNYMLGDFAASSADCAETLRLEPRHFGAMSGQGMMHLQQKNNALALIHFRRALKFNPHMDNIRNYIELLSRKKN